MFYSMVPDILILIRDVASFFFIWSYKIGKFIVSALCLIARSIYSSTEKLSNLLQILVGDFKLFAQDVGGTTSNIVNFLGDIYNYCSCFVDQVTSGFSECLKLIWYGIHFFFANVYLSLQSPVVFIYEFIKHVCLVFYYLIMLPKTMFDSTVYCVMKLPFLFDSIKEFIVSLYTIFIVENPKETCAGLIGIPIILALYIIMQGVFNKILDNISIPFLYTYIKLKLDKFNWRRKKLPKNHELNRSEDDSYLCIICQADSRCIVLMPCRHLCLCNKCSNELVRFRNNNCPICRQETLFRIKVYL